MLPLGWNFGFPVGIDSTQFEGAEFCYHMKDYASQD